MDKICDKGLNNACDRFNPAAKHPLLLSIRTGDTELEGVTGQLDLGFGHAPVFFLITQVGFV